MFHIGDRVKFNGEEGEIIQTNLFGLKDSIKVQFKTYKRAFIGKGCAVLQKI